MTKKPKRVMTKASKAGCRLAGGLRRKLGEDFLAHLNRSWELHGREILVPASGRSGPNFISRRWSS
jgi:hypothetical protein